MVRDAKREDLPMQVLAEYGLEPESQHKQFNKWLLDCGQEKLAVWEYQGNQERLEGALGWQEYLNMRGASMVLPLLKTKKGKLFYRYTDTFFYVTSWQGGKEFDNNDKDHLLACVRGLGENHKSSLQYQERNQPDNILPLPCLIQDKLVDLLVFSQYIKENKPRTDFERIYLEGYYLFYNQGQEAVQHMVMAGCGLNNRNDNNYLINSFLHSDIFFVDGKVKFTNLTRWKEGPATMDLALFLNSYMPLFRWDSDLMREILREYQVNMVLGDYDKHLLMAQLRFPNRYWLYVYKYLKGDGEPEELTHKLKIYLAEYQWRDRCLDQMHSWLWEE